MRDRIRDAIAGAVRAEMARKQKTQDDLAAALDLPQQSVSLRLTGKRSFRAEELVVAAQLLDTPVTAFLPAPAPAGSRRGRAGV